MVEHVETIDRFSPWFLLALLFHCMLHNLSRGGAMTSTFASRPGDSGSVSSSRRIWKIRSALPVGPAKNWYQRRTWGEKATYMILITSNAGIGHCRDLGCRYFETHSNIRLTITIDFLKDLFILSLHLEAPSWSTLLGCSPEGHALTWHWSHHPPSAGWVINVCYGC